METRAENGQRRTPVVSVPTEARDGDGNRALAASAGIMCPVCGAEIPIAHCWPRSHCRRCGWIAT